MEPMLIFLSALLIVLILTTYVRLHPFLSLVLTSLCIGIMAGRPEEALSTISSGMGKVFSQFAIIITAGSILGLVLEKTGRTGRVYRGTRCSFVNWCTALPDMVTIVWKRAA